MDNPNKNFCEVILDTNLWRVYVNRLKESYKLLEKNDWISQTGSTGDVNNNGNHYTTTIMMLKGMTLECLFKGILVKQGNITCKNEELNIPKKYSTHDLMLMADDIKDLSYTNKEKDILERLGYYIVAGRLPRKKVNTGKFKGFWSTDDNSAYDNMLSKIEKIYSGTQDLSNW
jgi:hypothetical protein